MLESSGGAGQVLVAGHDRVGDGVIEGWQAPKRLDHIDLVGLVRGELDEVGHGSFLGDVIGDGLGEHEERAGRVRRGPVGPDDLGDGAHVELILEQIGI